MNILFLTDHPEWTDRILNSLAEHQVTVAASLAEAEADLSAIEAVSGFVTHPMTANEMDQLPQLKLITTRSTGFDHIDLEAARERGIQVANVPSYGEHTVAEFTFALLLSLSRKIYDTYHQVRESGSFSRDGLRGFDLQGKTLGIIGTGRIGLTVAEIAKGFSMNVLGYDPFPKEAEAERIGFSYTDLDDLLRTSDIVTLHAPYNEHTHHLLDAEALAKVKPGAYLLNAARGGLLETRALVDALEEGRIAGAALDVLEEEGELGDDLELLAAPHPNAEQLQTLLAGHYLIDHPRVIITPHNAFNSTEAMERILDTTTENLRSFAEGRPVNIVA